MDNTLRTIRLGGYMALALAVMQIGGNALHPPMPADTVASIHVIQAKAALWVPVHVVITVSYFLFVPFAIGLAAAFRKKGPLVRFGTPLVIVGAGIGVVQILTHPTIFYALAVNYGDGTNPLANVIVEMYAVLWKYSVSIEVAHLLAIFITATLFGLEMRDEPHFKKWIAWLGVAGGVIAAAGIIVGKFIVTGGQTGDLIFGFGLIPALIWIIATGITLIRIKPDQVAAQKIFTGTAAEPVAAGR